MSGKRGKNDAADAAAICEAVTRPNMRFVPVKSIEQQSRLFVHRARQGYVEQRTALINRIRGLLSKLGIVLPLKAATVRREAHKHLEDLPGWCNTVVGNALSELTRLDERINQYDKYIVSNGQVPENYMIQVQHQLFVSDARQAHLWVYSGERGVLHAIERDVAAMQRIRDGWEQFQRYLDSDSPPPLTDADTVLRDDSDWVAAAQAFSAAKQATDVADTALAKARDDLVALAQHSREQGSGVSVTRYWKAGNVDYKKVPMLKGVDLELYRGKAREEVRVTTAP